MKVILAAVLCTAAITGQISPASAQLGPPGPYYYYGSPAGIYYAQPQQAPGLGCNGCIRPVVPMRPPAY
jgi:hypothetical protein